MAAARVFDVARTDRRLLTSFGTRSVVMARTVPGSVEDVWSACTDPERLAQWLGVMQGNLEYGQMFTFYGATCEVVGCQPPHRVEVSWTLMGETNTLRVTVSDRPGGTELVVEHAGIRNPVLLAYGPSWEERLSHLETHLLGEVVQQHDCRVLEGVLRPLWWQLLPLQDRPSS